MAEFFLGAMTVVFFLNFIVTCGISKTLTNIEKHTSDIQKRFNDIRFIINDSGRIQ